MLPWEVRYYYTPNLPHWVLPLYTVYSNALHYSVHHLLSCQHCTVLYTVLYTALYCILYCTLYCTVLQSTLVILHGVLQAKGEDDVGFPRARTLRRSCIAISSAMQWLLCLSAAEKTNSIVQAVWWGHAWYRQH